jgi:hypothetical protein
MPFFGLNPQGVRLTPSPGASNSPTATTNGSAPLNNIVDTATAQNLPGMVAWFKDAQGQVSVLAYAIAQASIVYGKALIRAAGFLSTATGVASTAVKSGFDCNNVVTATTTFGGYAGNFAGIAAGSVSNTGAYFWRYISGFVPDALCATATASGTLLIVSGSVAGNLAGLPALNATSTNATVAIPVGVTLGLAPAAGGLASVYLTGWYM